MSYVPKIMQWSIIRNYEWQPYQFFWEQLETTGLARRFYRVSMSFAFLTCKTLFWIVPSYDTQEDFRFRGNQWVSGISLFSNGRGQSLWRGDEKGDGTLPPLQVCIQAENFRKAYIWKLRKEKLSSWKLSGSTWTLWNLCMSPEVLSLKTTVWW